MGTMTITINTGPKTFTHSRTVSGPHLKRFADAYRGLLGQVDDGNDGKRDMTDDELMAAFADGFFNGTKANVKRQEEIIASKTAKDGVDEIGMS